MDEGVEHIVGNHVNWRGKGKQKFLVLKVRRLSEKKSTLTSTHLPSLCTLAIGPGFRGLVQVKVCTNKSVDQVGPRILIRLILAQRAEQSILAFLRETGGLISIKLFSLCCTKGYRLLVCVTPLP